MKKFLSLYITNFLGVLNDNTLKTLVCFIAVAWVSPEYKSVVISASAGALVLPYLFFSPLAGKLPNFCSKTKIIRIAKWAELPIMVIAIFGFFFQSVYVALLSIVLMGLQSALFSPAKYGLIKDIGGADGISQGMGGMEAVSFIGILLGTVVASFMAELSPWWGYSTVLVGVAAFGVVSSYFIKTKEVRTVEYSSANPFKFIRDTHRMLKEYDGLNGVIHLLSLFWWLSATIQIVTIIYADDTLGLSPMSVGCMMALIAIGISVGCLIGGRLDKRRYMLGAAPLIGIVVSVFLLLIFFCGTTPILFTIFAVGVATCGGIFKIPLDAEIQKRIDTSRLNIVLAYFNLVSFIYIFMASATTVVITTFLPTRYVFLALAVVFGLATIIFAFNYRPVLCNIGKRFISLHYKVRHVNREVLSLDDDKDKTNLLILPQHTAIIDPIMLFSELHDIKLQPLVDEGFFKISPIRHVLSLFDAVEVPDLRLSRKGVEQVRQLDAIVQESLTRGDNIIFYPSGHITTDGTEKIGSRHLAYTTCSVLPTHTKVIAIRIRGLWGSRWSRYNRKSTPSIVRLLAESVVLIFSCAILFMRRRTVTFEYIDITDEVSTWTQEGKLPFNRHLEELYNTES